jgi:hypothetical protein
VGNHDFEGRHTLFDKENQVPYRLRQ